MWGPTEHRMCCFGINHWRCSDPHHLFMLDTVTTTDTDGEATPNVEVVGATEDENLETVDSKQTLQKGLIRYYNKRQQLELVLAAQELFEIGDREVDPIASGDEDKCGIEMKGSDIWQDTTCMAFLRERMLPEVIELEEGKRAKK
ncbi:unnamed protein product [Sphagnum jensenii]|uniref:Uncharacterized protein n=1 Tax=Sphagnum jensenii TaxID=128206 RepID=A0ABP1B523_9BRYO